jgi:hypothetical protein
MISLMSRRSTINFDRENSRQLRSRLKAEERRERRLAARFAKKAAAGGEAVEVDTAPHHTQRETRT